MNDKDEQRLVRRNDESYAAIFNRPIAGINDVNRSESSGSGELKKGSSRIVVELSEADQDPLLKIDKIPKSVTHAFHCLDRIVNTFNDARGHPMREVV